MRVDRVIRDWMRSLRQVLQALDNNITVQDNFGPSGAPEGSIIVSVGRERKPEWNDGSALVTTVVKTIIEDHQSNLVGPPGPSGGQGPPGPAGISGAAAEPLVDGLGDIVYFYHDGNQNLDLLMVFNEHS